MFANITHTKNLRHALMYNEHKIPKGHAESIWAENFLDGHTKLTLADKEARFLQRTTLNEHWPNQGIHISLNFGVGEMIDNQKMAVVAREYMKQMGFQDQPYLVYRHSDAPHEHCHVVTPRVDENGLRINMMYDWGRSRKVCRKLEEDFGLVHFKKSVEADQMKYAVTNAQIVQYGERPLARSFSDVLNTVFDHYHYTDLREYDALLRQYGMSVREHIASDRPQKATGLSYLAIDESGRHIGSAIKASYFLLKPTLPRLEQRFSENLPDREMQKQRLQTNIDWAFAGEAPSWETFIREMKAAGLSLQTVKRPKDQKGELYFISHADKYCISSDSLGPAYGMESLRQRCVAQEETRQEQSQTQRVRLHF